MKHHRITAVAVAVLFAAFLFAGCSDDTGNNGTNNGPMPDASNNGTADMEGDDAGNNGEVDGGNNGTMDMDVEPDLGPGEDRLPVAFTVFPPVPTNCDNPGAIQRLPFVFTSSDVPPIVTGDMVAGLPVEPNQTLDTGSVHPRRARVSKATEIACASQADCPAGFKCAYAGVPGAQRFCTVQTGVEFVPRTIRPDYDQGRSEDQKQLVTVLIENTAIYDGRLPTVAGELYAPTGATCSTDGDCQASGARCIDDECVAKDLFAKDDRATDPTRIHRESLKDFMVQLASVADPLNTLVSVWFFGGQVGARARPLTGDTSAVNDFYTNDLSVAQGLIDTMPNPVPRVSNVWQSILNVVEKDLGLDKYADYEKFLFVFTDGANEVYDGEATYDDVLEAMDANDVHVYFIHLDNSIDPSLLRDLPTAWAGNKMCRDDPSCVGAPPCSSDDQCRNFEECRPAKQYPDAPEDPVTETTSSYCLPTYDASGRLGPIDLYSDIACRTRGNYVYVTRPGQMRPWLRILPSVVDGQFSMETDFSALADEDVAHGFYRLSGTFVGVMGGKDLPSKLSAKIPGNPATIDTRTLLRRGNP